MLGIWWLALITGGLGCFWLYRRSTKPSRLPPGPKGWPLVGNAFQQDPGRPYLTWTKWADKYGEVFTINNFGTPMVLCNSYRSVYEMLVTKSNDFAGRPDLYPLRYITDGAIDVGMGDFSSHWVHRKKVLMTSLKMYGDGLERLETIMQDVITDLIEDISSTKQQPFDPMNLIQLTVCNTLALLLLGDRFGKEDPDFVQLLEHTGMFSKIFTPSVEFFLLSTCPWLHYVPLPYCKAMERFVNGFHKDWLPRMIKKRMTHNEGKSPECILDAFLKQHESDLKSHAKDPLEMRHVVMLSFDIFLGGMVTSSTSMYTILALMAVKPDIQAKVQTEIDLVLGGRRPTLEDKQSMPYFQAMLEEVLRYCNISNAFVHKTTVDSSICGYFIPKGTQVWPNVWHLCHNHDLYKDPWTFKPERFLDASGEFLSADHPLRKNVLVFGAGRRVCPGAHLARSRIFLLTVSLLQSFVFKSVTGEPLPQSDPRTFPPSSTFKPSPYRIRAVPRN